MNLLALHLPDGFMSAPLALAGWVLALPALLWSFHQCREGDDRETTLAALLAAFLFAAQTFHFPVPGGTSGHLVGATLVVILCGPALGLLTLTSVVVLQALVFGDGGLFTMGWNLSNMGLVSGFVGGSLYNILRRRNAPAFGAALLAGWSATLLAALCTGLELALAGLTPLPLSLSAMLSVQLFMGFGEGLVTAATVSFLARTRPQLLHSEKSRSIVPGLIVLTAVGLATLAPPTVYGMESGQYPGVLAYIGVVGVTLVAGAVLMLWGKR